MEKIFKMKWIVCIVLLLMVVACGKKEEGKQEKTRVIKVSHVFQTSEPTHIYISQAAERINERLKGQIEFQVYPNGELPSETRNRG